VRLTPASTQTVTISWQAVNGPAQLGSDIELVNRVLPNQPAMVTLLIEDDCGVWKTFIGTGQNPW
jgi:hypothetical protein